MICAHESLKTYLGAANTAIGVRGQWVTAKDVNPSDDPNKKHRFVDLRPLERTAKGAAGSVTYSPKPQGDTQPFTAEFPEKVQVGDIKPIWTVAGKPTVEPPALGTVQLANYQYGITEFVKIAAAEKKVTRSTLPTSVLTGLSIPPGLDYKNFDKENKSPSADTVVTGGITGPERYWMFEPPGTGLYYYFKLAHPNPSSEVGTKLMEAFAKLVPVKQELSMPDDGIHNKLNLPKLLKRRFGTVGRRLDRKRTGSKVNSNLTKLGPVGTIQRKESARVTKDSGALGKAWEQKRANWDKQYAKPLLASKEGKALNERVAINDAIGVTGDTSPASIAAQGKQLKTIDLWSGTTGVLLGKARFLLGGTFDKIAGAFEWAKGKLSGIWNKLTKAKPPDGGFGWRKTLVNLLIKAVKLGFRELVSVFFEMCANCLEGIIQKVVGKFTEEISDELAKQVEELRVQFDRYENVFKTGFEQRVGSWDKFTKDLSTVEQWTDMLLSMEALIRLGLQVVSCLSPPALGCLWGLVAQVGLDVALDLIMGTEWFQEHIINHPSVRGLIKQFAGPTIRSLIADTLSSVGLEDYAKDVDACSKVKDIEPPPIQPIDPVSPAEFQERRAKWERVNRPQMLQDLQFRFQTKEGVPATEADLEQLVGAMGRSGMSAEELKKTIESTPRSSNGKRDLNAIRRRLLGDVEKREPVPGVGFRPLKPIPDVPSDEARKSDDAPGLKLKF